VVERTLQTVIETAEFLFRASKMMSDEQRARVVEMLARDPECGDIMAGTGGIRKVRVALTGRGKSGGARVIYFSTASDSRYSRSPSSQRMRGLTSALPSETRWLPSFGLSSNNWKGDIMGKKAFDSIMAGLEDALAYAKGDKARGRATVFDARELDVGKVRGKVGLSQDEFARAFGVSVGTLRNWEQRRVKPDGPARVLLTVIDRDPVSVLKALRIGPKRTTTRRRRAA